MKDKQTLTNEVSPRYRKAGKKEKGTILDEFINITGYTRKYAIHLLSTWNTTHWVNRNGILVRLKTGTPQKRKKRTGTPRYGPDVIKVVRLLWAEYDYRCGKLLAPQIRLILPFLEHDEIFGPLITPEITAQLLTISGATIDRRLQADRKKLALTGKTLTKPGTLLKNQIPIRAYFSWDERKPGYFEMDTVSHCGTSSYGEFCSTVNLTDVSSGWVELRAARNRAHSRVKQSIIDIRDSLPFPLKGVDSDSGGEFINHQVWHWCTEHGVEFTRSRPYRKNDNCFVEQKNGDIVRKAVGYYRYDTDEETAALAEVYRLLCPLVNFWYPSIKITGKERLENGKLKKSYDTPKTPYQRLLESPDLSTSVKAELQRRAAATNPVMLKRLEHQAVARLLQIHERKQGEGLPPLSDAHG
ncbi:MAG: transposase family protein [Treponema sp.]|nr:transposase family protein [Treponema sp.]